MEKPEKHGARGAVASPASPNRAWPCEVLIDRLQYGSNLLQLSARGRAAWLPAGRGSPPESQSQRPSAAPTPSCKRKGGSRCTLRLHPLPLPREKILRARP